MRNGEADGRSEPRNSGVDAFLAVRARFHLTYRVAIRALQLAVPDGGAHTTGWRLVLAGFLALDFVQWLALRNPARFGLKTRLVIDTVDMTVWSLAPYPPGVQPILAVLGGFPLLMEAGLRHGAVALLVPVIPGATMVTANVIAGRNLAVHTLAWLYIGVGCGLLLRRYLHQVQRQRDDEWVQRRSAEHRRAFLAGQNSVAMGASSAVDVLESMLPLIGRPQPGSVLWDLADAWKTSLSEATAGHAAYLGLVLSEWAAEHNRHPDLASRVALELPEGTGTILLTADQARHLRHALTSLGLRGVVAVEIDPALAHRAPGGPVRLRVGSSAVELPADTAHTPRPVDPGPSVFALGAGLMVSDTFGFPLSPPNVLPMAILSLLAARWAHRRVRRLGRAAWPGIMVAVVLVAVLYTATATLGTGSGTNAAGIEIYPVVVGWEMTALVAGMYWHGLGRAVRGFTVVGAVAVGLVSLALHPIGHDPLTMVVQSLWGLPLLVTTLKLAGELDRTAAESAGALLAADREHQAAAFRRGQQAVIDLVCVARDEAERQLATVAGSLSPDVTVNVQRRLKEVDQRLATLGGSAPSSSTTTS